MINTNYLYILLTSIIFFSFPATVIASDDEPVENVLEQLQMSAVVLGLDGFNPAEEPLVFMMDEDEKRSAHMKMIRGHHYTLVAVCDDDCDDVDIRLLAPNGKVVDVDDGDKEPAVIDGVIPSTGIYTVEIRLSDCNSDPCAVAAAPFRR
jgi:hypothetical protein